MNLNASDFQKLAKLLGLLGSTHDGESLPPARQAQALASQLREMADRFDKGFPESTTPENTKPASASLSGPRSTKTKTAVGQTHDQADTR